MATDRPDPRDDRGIAGLEGQRPRAGQGRAAPGAVEVRLAAMEGHLRDLVDRVGTLEAPPGLPAAGAPTAAAEVGGRRYRVRVVVTAVEAAPEPPQPVVDGSGPMPLPAAVLRLAEATLRVLETDEAGGDGGESEPPHAAWPEPAS